jgi:ABC-type polysaccharide/polyol phosphate export systems, permease component
MSAATHAGLPAGIRDRLLYHLRVLHVVASAEFKLKYAGSALGYVWSLIKPLTLFTMLYLVFGRVFKLGSISHYYPLSLLLGIVLITFFNDATNLGMTSLVARESLLRKLSFPRMVVPTAATLTAAMTFCVNLVAIVAFIAWNHLTPHLNWLLLIPLLLELYLFTLAVALVLATVFVRVRDVGQIWELVLQVIFYASPIIYPIGYLPGWARKFVFLNPLTQVLQDIRSIVLSSDLKPNRITVAVAFHSSAARLIPIGIAAILMVAAVLLFRREEPYFAERV